jgi:hypothetical protein
MRPIIHLLVIGGFSASALAAETTALDALKLLPKEKAKNLALIEARDGTPNPDRWYLLVQDSTEENGFREYVVEGRQIVADRALSQFTEKLAPEDVIRADSVKIDSDRVVKIAQQYAKASKFPITRISYELKKNDDDTTPVWKVNCWDDAGNMAEVTVAATKGTVLSHDGFTLEARADNEKKRRMEAYNASQNQERDLALPRERPAPSNSRAPEPEDGAGHAIGRTLRKLFGGGR